jgi:lysozyme
MKKNWIIALFLAFMAFTFVASGNELQLSPVGRGYIKAKEGTRLKAYFCSAHVLTIGCGHTGSDVYVGMVITKEEERRLFNIDSRKFVNYVNRQIDRPLKQCEFEAAVSGAYNFGYLIRGNLLNAIETYNEPEFERCWLNIHHAGGKDIKGLITRRIEEVRRWQGRHEQEFLKYLKYD